MDLDYTEWLVLIAAVLYLTSAVNALYSLRQRLLSYQAMKRIAVEREQTLGELNPWEVGWCVPWAFYWYAGVAYADSEHTVLPHAVGTAAVQIRRLHAGVEILEWPQGQVLRRGVSFIKGLPLVNLDVKGQVFEERYDGR